MSICPFAFIAGALALTVSLGARDNDALATWLESHVQGFSGAVLVARGDSPLLTKSYGLANRRNGIANTPDTQFNLGSINKTFTAVAVAQLADAGTLAFDDTLARWLPDHPNAGAAKRITLHQLLTHRAGLRPFMRLPAADSLADLARAVAAEPLAHEPGAHQQYSNGGYVLLGRILEAASGLSYSDYLHQRICDPAGMKATAFVTPGSGAAAIGYFLAGPGGEPMMSRGGPPPTGGTPTENTPFIAIGNPAGGGYSTVGDLLRFGVALREGRLLSRKMTDYLLNGTFTALPGSPFGYGLREQRVGTRRFVGNGGGAPGINAEFRMEPAGPLTVVVMANASPPAATRLLTELLTELAK